MPLTPFHLGPGLFFGMLSSRFLDLSAFLLGSVILDIEPLIAFLSGNFENPHHHFTSFLGGILGAVIVWLIIKIFRKKKTGLSNLSIFLGGLVGCWIHVIFDALMHYDVLPFWPLKINPFLNLISISQNYLICLILGTVGLILLAIKFKKHVQ